jgi:predicted Zn-dependent protease
MSSPSRLHPNAEQQRVAAQLAEKARQAVATMNFDYGIALYSDCCKIDPGNLIFRKALRQAQKVKYRNNLTGSSAFGLATWGKRLKLRAAVKRKQYRQALELGEAILAKNPWHTPTQLQMAQAAEGLDLCDVAVFILEQARQKNPDDRRVNVPLAQLHERLGHYGQAVRLYELAAKADPTDAISARKIKDLAATATLAKGKYEDRTFSPEQVTGSKKHAPLQSTPQPQNSPIQKKLNEIESLRAKIQAEPNNPHHYLDLARLYCKEEKWEDARSILDASLAGTGNNFDIHLAIADLEIEPYRQNLKIARHRLEKEPQNAQLRTQVARLSREVLARESQYFRLRTDRSPSDYAGRLELGVRLTELNLPDEAIPELQQGRKDARLRWRALLYLGHAFRQKRNWPLAKRNYEEALLALPPGSDEEARKNLLLHLAKGAADAGDWPAALQHGNELANNDYGYHDIGAMLEQWNKKLQGAPA